LRAVVARQEASMGDPRGIAVAVALLFPAHAWALAHGEEGGAEEEEVGWGGEGDVSGGPLDLSHLGRAPRPAPPLPPPPEEEDYWGLEETKLVLVPAGSARPSWSDEIPRIPPAPWPPRAMRRAWHLADAYSYSALAPGLDAELFTVVGVRDQSDQVLLSERLRLNLYFLELGVTYLSAVDDQRSSRTDMDLDFRIPIALGRHQQLALLPGVTFPIDARPKSDRNSAIRFQGIYGFGAGGFGFQARVGYVDGHRSRGLLFVQNAVHNPAFLYGGLLAWRFVPAVQLRLEASGEVATDDGTDRLTLLGGPVFFPLGDPRVSLGVLGVVEDSSRRLEFSDPGWGALVQVGIGFL
jgi:hypothetical protein